MRRPFLPAHGAHAEHRRHLPPGLPCLFTPHTAFIRQPALALKRLLATRPPIHPCSGRPTAATPPHNPAGRGCRNSKDATQGHAPSHMQNAYCSPGCTAPLRMPDPIGLATGLLPPPPALAAVAGPPDAALHPAPAAPAAAAAPPSTACESAATAAGPIAASAAAASAAAAAAPAAAVAAPSAALAGPRPP